MTFMIWTDKMSVGVPAIDAEHRELVEMIDELYEGMFAGSSEASLENTMDKLIKYTDVHFRHEEQLFEQAHYPQLAKHKAQHDILRRRAREFREKISGQNSTIAAAELLRFLKEWLAHHIQGDDKAAGAFLKSKGVK